MYVDTSIYDKFNNTRDKALQMLAEAGVYVDPVAVTLVIMHSEDTFTVIAEDNIINYVRGYVIIRKTKNWAEERPG